MRATARSLKRRAVASTRYRLTSSAPKRARAASMFMKLGLK
jgi:hypothetical protein